MSLHSSAFFHHQPCYTVFYQFIVTLDTGFISLLQCVFLHIHTFHSHVLVLLLYKYKFIAHTTLFCTHSIFCTTAYCIYNIITHIHHLTVCLHVAAYCMCPQNNNNIVVFPQTKFPINCPAHTQHKFPRPANHSCVVLLFNHSQ